MTQLEETEQAELTVEQNAESLAVTVFYKKLCYRKEDSASVVLS